MIVYIISHYDNYNSIEDRYLNDKIYTRLEKTKQDLEEIAARLDYNIVDGGMKATKFVGVFHSGHKTIDVYSTFEIEEIETID